VHRLLAILLLSLMMSCVRAEKPASPASLVGLSVPLVTSPSLRLALGGRLDGRPIVVHLDPHLPALLPQPHPHLAPRCRLPGAPPYPNLRRAPRSQPRRPHTRRSQP